MADTARLALLVFASLALVVPAQASNVPGEGAEAVLTLTPKSELMDPLPPGAFNSAHLTESSPAATDGIFPSSLALQTSVIPCFPPSNPSIILARDVSELPFGIAMAGAASVLGKIYIVGGRTGNSVDEWKGLDTILGFDPDTGVVSTLYELPTSLLLASVVAWTAAFIS